MDYMEKDIFKLDDSWKNIRTIIPFGLGRIGKRVLPKLKETFHIPFIIDNGVEERAYDGISIYRLGDALPLIKDNKIVVMTKENIYEVISKELKQRGYVEYRDYCILERFMAEWHFKYERKCYLSKINSVITSKCSFNCNHCAMFIPYCEKREDCSLTSIKENLKSLFSVVDYIFEYTLLGGEPFLHKELKQILEFINIEYGQKIGQVVVITNGAVIPHKELLLLLKECNIMLSISSYLKSIDYSTKFKELIRVLNENQIMYYVNSDIEWKDHCYPHIRYKCDESNLREHMKMCGYNVHSVNEGKLYYCEVAWGARKHTGFSDSEDDYIDLDGLRRKFDLTTSKLKIIEYCMGNINEKGYMEFCRYCAGSGADNTRVIQAGT